MKERYFITGATGLIGEALTKRLVDEGQDVTVFVRNFEKAKRIFAEYPQVSIVTGDLQSEISYEDEIDYIVHGAAPTGSNFFMEKPVETIDSIILGTRSILELAKQKKVKSVVNLSSMEMYGVPTDGELLTEDKQFYLDPLNVRSNYPMAKRLAETMCVSYFAEYDVPVKSIRLAQVLGKKLLPDDNRVIAHFIRSAKQGVDITLATDGTTKQTYVGIDDALSGILTILHKGVDGDAYNLANDETYCSIKDMADIVARDIAGGDIKVSVNSSPSAGGKYPPTRTLRLSSAKLEKLGWKPKTDLQDALRGLADGSAD